MKIFRHIEDQGLSMSGTVATMGNSTVSILGTKPGAHTVEESKRLGYPSTVLTFEPHPLKVLAPERAPLLILSTRQNGTAPIAGVDIVVASALTPVCKHCSR
jgi:riboflavin kinase/FMN adenylyltransferase